MNAPRHLSAVDAYLEGPPKQVPGLASLHRMVGLLMAERVPNEGCVLVVGAGGGMEINALASEHAGWTFAGVDPSREMLELAARTVERYADRVTFHEGRVDTAPFGPFDGAVSLLTFHFIHREQRLDTLKAIHGRLKKGAPLVLAHISIPRPEHERSLWMTRHFAFSGVSGVNMERAKQAMSKHLSILSPEEEEALLKQAGFSGVSLFYAGFSFKGWVAYAA
jgi:tRNA (cmo5U34)-methyltransferase